MNTSNKLKLSSAFCAAAALVLSTGLWTADAQAATTITGEVKRIYITTANTVNFRIKGDSCKSVAGSPSYWNFKLGTPATDAWYSMLLSAALAKKPVKVSVPDCKPASHQTIRYIYMDF